jgi:hypothetical protein
LPLHRDAERIAADLDCLEPVFGHRLKIVEQRKIAAPIVEAREQQEAAEGGIVRKHRLVQRGAGEHPHDLAVAELAEAVGALRRRVRQLRLRRIASAQPEFEQFGKCRADVDQPVPGQPGADRAAAGLD